MPRGVKKEINYVEEIQKVEMRITHYQTTIKELEEKLFQIQMIDVWTNADSHEYDRTYYKLRRLKELVGCK